VQPPGAPSLTLFIVCVVKKNHDKAINYWSLGFKPRRELKLELEELSISTKDT
jgi:hypothetical protein